jgi:hypothetical protein
MRYFLCVILLTGCGLQTQIPAKDADDTMVRYKVEDTNMDVIEDHQRGIACYHHRIYGAQGCAPMRRDSL